MTITIGRVTLQAVSSLTVTSSKDAEDFFAPSGLGRSADGPIASREYELEGVEVGVGAQTVMDSLHAEHRRRGDVYVLESSNSLPEGYYKLVDVEVEATGPGARRWAVVLREQRDPTVWHQLESLGQIGSSVLDLEAEEQLALEVAPTLSGFGKYTPLPGGQFSIPSPPNGNHFGDLSYGGAGRYLLVGGSFAYAHLYEVTLTNDVRDLTYVGELAATAACRGVYLAEDGLTVWTCSAGGDPSISEWSLSTAFDLTTATLAAQHAPPSTLGSHGKIEFGNNGLKCYAGQNGWLAQFSLSTPYDLSTATLDGETTWTNGFGLSVSADGLALLGFSAGAGDVRVRQTQSAWDFVGTYTDTTIQTGLSLRGVALLDSKLSLNNAGSTLYQGLLADAEIVADGDSLEAFNLPLGTWRPHLRLKLDAGDKIEELGSRVFTLDATEGVRAWALDPAYDLSSAEAHSTGDVPAGSPYFLTFSTPGTRLFWMENGGKVYAQDLTSPFDVSTFASPTEHTVGSGFPCGLWFSPDGRSFFHGDRRTTTYYLSEYALSTPFDLSSKSFVQEVVVSLLFSSFTWHPDGTVLYTLQQNKIRRYTASTAFDVSTLSYVGETTIAGLSTGASYGFQWHDDGAKLLITQDGPKTHSLSATTPYDETTLTVDYTLSAGQRGAYILDLLLPQVVVDIDLTADSMGSEFATQSISAYPDLVPGVWQEIQFGDMVVSAAQHKDNGYVLAHVATGIDGVLYDRVRFTRVG